MSSSLLHGCSPAGLFSGQVPAAFLSPLTSLLKAGKQDPRGRSVEDDEEEEGRTGMKNRGKWTMNREMREEVIDPERRSDVTVPTPSPQPLQHPFLYQRSLFLDANCSFISSHCICLALLLGACPVWQLWIL